MNNHTDSFTESRAVKFFAPLIDSGISTSLADQCDSFTALLQEAQRLAAGDSPALPQAAIAWLTTRQSAFTNDRLQIRDLTHSSHTLMLHATLNALPIADISSAEPNVIEDSSTRPDFENVCPLRFLALFPIPGPRHNTVGYLVLYDVNPMPLSTNANAALTTLAQNITVAHQ